jgi:hypothetical protein
MGFGVTRSLRNRFGSAFSSWTRAPMNSMPRLNICSSFHAASMNRFLTGFASAIAPRIHERYFACESSPLKFRSNG